MKWADSGRKNALIIVLVLAAVLLDLRSQGVEEISYAVKTDRPLTIDGVLNEPIWQKAPEVNEFLFFHKERSDPDKVQTSVRVLYDERNLYIGFICKDLEPGLIYAEVTDKDSPDLKFDDSVWVLLDVFNNLDVYFYFGMNVLGAKGDGQLKKEDLFHEPQWNGEWEGAAKRTEEGWTAELSVNLNFLMYTPREGDAINMSLSRIVPRLETTLLTEPLDPAFRLSELDGLKQIGFTFPEKKLKFAPYVLPTATIQGDFDFQAGLDVILKLSKNATSHLTVYPDFFTTEPDKEVFNLTRYELYLPEKRDFFGQGSNIYEMPHEQLFYSRRIGDIYSGLKFQGNTAGFEFSASSQQTQKNTELNENTANFSVLRLNKSVYGTSKLGLLAVNKMIDGENIGSAGLDTALNFSSSFSLKGQFALSYGHYSTDNLAFTLVPSYDTETTHLHLGLSVLQKSFGNNVNDVGYVWDDDRKELDLGLDKSFIMQKWGIERILYTSKYNIFWTTDGLLKSWEIDQGIALLKQNRFEVSLVHTQEYKLFEKEFRNYRTRFFLGFDSREWTLFNVIFTAGKNFDEDFLLLELNKRHTIGQEFSFEYAFQSLIAKLEERRSRYYLHMFSADYKISKDLWLQGFFQVNTEIDKLNLQLFFFYIFKAPKGTFQLGYQRGDPRYGIVGEEHDTIFIKVLYEF